MIWALWLAPVGIVVLAFGGLLQIWEEWEARGLTDTSYRSLLLMAAGPAMIALGVAFGLGPALVGLGMHQVHAVILIVVTVLVCLASSGLSLWFIYSKLYDFARTRRWLP